MEKKTEPEPFELTFQTPSCHLSESKKRESGTSERSQEKTNRNLKDSTIKVTCCTPESENGQSSDAYTGGSAHIRQVQTVEPSGTLKVKNGILLFKPCLLTFIPLQGHLGF